MELPDLDEIGGIKFRNHDFEPPATTSHNRVQHTRAPTLHMSDTSSLSSSDTSPVVPAKRKWTSKTMKTSIDSQHYTSGERAQLPAGEQDQQKPRLEDAIVSFQPQATRSNESRPTLFSTWVAHP